MEALKALWTFWNVVGIVGLITLGVIEGYLISKDKPTITNMYQAFIAKVVPEAALKTVYLILTVVGTIIMLPFPLDGNVKIFLGGIWWHLNLPSKL